jgi:hypothetical protein
MAIKDTTHAEVSINESHGTSLLIAVLHFIMIKKSGEVQDSRRIYSCYFCAKCTLLEVLLVCFY